MPDLWGYSRKALLPFAKFLKNLVSAAGFEPATHALKVLNPDRDSETLKKTE